MTRTVLIGGVQATLVGLDRISDKSKEIILVALAHGRTRSLEDSLKIATVLIDRVPNLVIAVWDLPNHGSRSIDPRANGDWNEGNVFHLQSLLALIDQGAREAETLLYFLPQYVEELRTHEKGVLRVLAGTSLGGHIAWKVAADNASRPGAKSLLDAVVPIISTPNLGKMMQERLLAQQMYSSQEREIALPPFVAEDLAQLHDRCVDLKSTTTPILALCGADDSLVPPSFSEEWAALSPHSPTKRVILFPGIGHAVPPQMVDELAAFLNDLTRTV